MFDRVLDHISLHSKRYRLQLQELEYGPLVSVDILGSEYFNEFDDTCGCRKSSLLQSHHTLHHYQFSPCKQMANPAIDLMEFHSLLSLFLKHQIPSIVPIKMI